MRESSFSIWWRARVALKRIHENAHKKTLTSFREPRKKKYSMASLCSLFSSECKSPDCVDYHPLFLSRPHSVKPISAQMQLNIWVNMIKNFHRRTLFTDACTISLFLLWRRGLEKSVHAEKAERERERVLSRQLMITRERERVRETEGKFYTLGASPILSGGARDEDLYFKRLRRSSSRSPSFSPLSCAPECLPAFHIYKSLPQR